MIQRSIEVDGVQRVFELHPYPTGPRMQVHAPGVPVFDVESVDEARDRLRAMYAKEAGAAATADAAGRPPRIAEVFGREAADKLARLAVDLLLSAPARIVTATTRVPAALIAEGREVLDDAKFDWRAFITEFDRQQREARHGASSSG